MVDLLIKKEANIHLADNKGRTLLYYAAKNEDTQLVKDLLGKGAEYVFDGKSPPLKIAVKNNNEEIITSLLNKANDNDNFDKVKKLAIKYAKQENNEDLIKYIKTETQNETQRRGCLIM